MKIDRGAVLEKYGGRCAYCGEILTLKTMQVDHIWPQRLAHWKKDYDINSIENLNPACRKCNNFKGGMILNPDTKYLADFRKEIERQIDRLRKISQFDRALRFGLVTITGKPVQFYYEQYESLAKPN
jgi:5-methylcytosine-specific restriction endonuclease McrA